MAAYFTLTAITGYAYIFFARVCDVSLQSMRTIMMVRGERLKAAILGFFEVLIYVIVLGKVFDSLDNPANLLAYALGYASGYFVGGFIEEKLAIGVQFIQIITMKNPLQLAQALREKGYGVTVLEGKGYTGPQFVLQVLISRKAIKALTKQVDEWDINNFMIVTDARKYQGGIVTKQKMFADGMVKKGK